MKYFMLFLYFLVVMSTVLASGNGEIVMYDVYANSDSGVILLTRYLDPASGMVGWHWAHASVNAESGSEGWYSVWAQAGYDTDDSYDGGSYIAGSNGHSRYKVAGNWVYSNDDPDNRFGYTYNSAYINSQDDEDWSPKWK